VHDDADLLRGCGLAEDDVARLLTRAARSAPLGLGNTPAHRRLELAVVAAADAQGLRTALPALLRAIGPDRGTLDARSRAVDDHLRGLVAWRVDADMPRAVASWNRSVARLSGVPGGDAYAGRVHDTFGQLLHHQGLLVDARDAYELALASKRAGGDAAGVALTLGNLGRLCMALGDFRAASIHLDDDLAHVRATTPRDSRLESLLLTQLGACRTELGRHADARASLVEGHALARDHADAFGLGFAETYLGRLALREGDLVDASTRVEAAGRALARLPVDAVPELRGLVAELAARVRWARDDLVGATERVEEAERLFAASSRVPPVERAELHELHASIAEASGRRREAIAAMRRALTVLDATSADALRTRIDDALRRLDETAWMLHASGRFVGHAQLEELLGEAGRQGFRGHSEEVTVLFSDLRGFTRTTETLAPDVLVATLNRYFGLMTRCIEHFGGRVDKFIGDAVMAIFAARPGEASHADRAVAAAAYMAADLERFNATLPPSVGPLKMGIGLHAGPVIAGLLGSPQKRSYTVLGDVVNTASRTEGMTKTLDAPILLTSEVVRRMGEASQHVLVPLGRYRPVGRVASVDVHWLAGPRDGSPEATLLEAEAHEAHVALGRLAAGDAADAARRFAALAARAGPARARPAFERLGAAAQAAGSTAPSLDVAIELTEK